ncbi:MAG: hypothetical protein ACD_47C00507G0003, partial [uncultured bacterium]
RYDGLDNSRDGVRNKNTDFTL